MKFGIELPCAGFFLSPGLGKTTISFAIMKLLRKAGIMVRALVVAPLRPAYQVWPEEADIWEDFKDFKVVVLHGTKKEKLYRQIVAGELEADVIVVNPDGLRWLFDQKKVIVRGKAKISVDTTKFKALGCNVLFVDEASKFKNSGSDRFKLVKLVLDEFDRRYVLTGSPAPNGLMDLFGVMYLVDGGEALGEYITHYRNAYFNSTGYGGYTYTLREGADKEIYKRIAPTVLTMGDEYLDLPPLVQVPIYVDLPEDVRALYDEMEEEFFAVWDGGPLVASNAGAAMMKCAQIANGGIYLNQEVDEQGRKIGKREWKHLHEAKSEAVADYLEELYGHQCIITYDFEHDLDRLMGAVPKLGREIVRSGVSPKESKRIEDEWNASRVTNLLAQTTLIAHGLNLQKSSAQHILMHSLTYNYEDWDQLTRRLRRQGSKAKRIYLASVIARKTVDEAKMLAINKKRSGQDGLLGALKEYRKSRRR